MRRAAKVDRFGVDTSNNSYRGAGQKVCVVCAVEFHSYQREAKFCGQKCYHVSRRTLPLLSCQTCQASFIPNSSAPQKYCSVACMRKARPRVSFYIPHPRIPHITPCVECGVEFRSSKSSERKYCSYKCFLDSGGTRRAGDAAVMAMKKYGAKKDANHSLIFGIISAMTAAKDLSAAGFGVPDGIAWVNGGWHLFDIKNPKTGYGRRGLNSRQKDWADDWRGGPVYLIYTEEEAKAFARGRFDNLKSFPVAKAENINEALK